jgi:hypothetical protein
LTVNVWSAEAALERVVKFPSEETEVEMVGTSGAVTKNAVEEVALALPTATLIDPVVAPAGTVAVRLVLLVTVTLVEAVPLKETVAFEAKFVPVIVTEVPTGPELGVKEVMVGAVEEEGELDIENSSRVTASRPPDCAADS